MTTVRQEWEPLAGAGRFPLLLGTVVGLCAIFGCTRANPPPAKQPPPKARALEPTTPQPAAYPNLCADPKREHVLAAYLHAWRLRGQTPELVASARARLLAVYADVYRQVGEARDERAYDQCLRVLWDLCGVVHATAISPTEVKHAVGWQEPEPPRTLSKSEVTLAEAARHPVLTRFEGLPRICRRLLSATPATGVADGSYADYVTAHSRQVYLTAQLVEWSPAVPLDVCGSSEPLTRTLILTPAVYVDLSPKPEWSLAAVAVHESAHIAWFHRPEVGNNPRLLQVAPNEREAFRVMARFLEGMLSVEDPELKAYVLQHQTAIREQLREARENVARANERLGLPPGDMTERLDLAEE